MCGICGQYNFGNGAPVLREDIEAMTLTITHRGPDDDGYLFDGSLGLGFRRLSIIDLAGGHQPMADADPVALNLFLRYRYTPSPLTIFRGIEKLAPGTMLVCEEGHARRERWYRYTPVPFDRPKRDAEAAEELLELYRAAVRRHLVA